MSAAPPTPDRPAVIAAWSLYDWANSPFTTIVVTFVYGTYFTQAIAPDEISGTQYWSWAIAASGVLVALLSPLLGAIADRGGARRRFLITSTAACVVATAALTFVAPGDRHAMLVALALFVVANVAFEIGMVFYNAFLPDIASPARIGRVSGYGWALGYVGGLACLGVALLVLVRDTPMFAIPVEDGFNFRATNLLVAAWFALFAVPALLVLRDARRGPVRVDVSGGLRELAETFAKVRRYRDALCFLVARIVYNDGLVTVFAFGGIYAAGTFGMTLAEVIRFGIAINVAAGIGAWAFGFVDDRVGGRTTILMTLVALIAFTLIAALAADRTWLWVAGIGLGAFVGPNQAASRSLMGRFSPERHRNEFFGFFAFSGKFTAFVGPLALGTVTAWSGSQRVGVAVLIAFFVVGALLLLWVDERRGARRRLIRLQHGAAGARRTATSSGARSHRRRPEA